MKWSGVKAPIVSALLILTGCASNMEQMGLSYRGETAVENARLLIDETWVDESGARHVDQEIFDSVFSIIDEAEEFILMDFFLINDFLYQPGPGMRPVSEELTDRLLTKRKTHPDLPIIFITDPLNSFYGSLESPHFSALQKKGVHVVWTDLNQFRDSNPIYSKPWRLLIKPWGVGPGKTLPNPIGDGRVSIRSMLKLFNFKANHRKLIVSEKSLLVSSANPHSASSAHWNVALRVDGAGVGLAVEAEAAILALSGSGEQRSLLPRWTDGKSNTTTNKSLQLLTEGRIEERVIELLRQAGSGMRIDLAMFYLSDHDVLEALMSAKKRGCAVRVILDPNKDAFGRTKNGIPNRQSAARLMKAGIPVRWANTHGEQFHVKMLYVEHLDHAATVLLGSCNFTRRNMENFNAECNVSLTAPHDDGVMLRARDAFDGWWMNPDGRFFTTDYQTYEDRSLLRRVRAWFKERTGMSSF